MLISRAKKIGLFSGASDPKSDPPHLSKFFLLPFSFYLLTTKCQLIAVLFQDSSEAVKP